MNYLVATPGTPDPTFAEDGTFYLDEDYTLTQVTALADGGVLASGTDDNPPNLRVCLLKLDRNGVRAPDFGSNGIASVDPEITLGADINSVVELPSGKLLVLAVAIDPLGVAFPFVIRLTAQGAPDATFGPDHNGLIKLPLLGGHPNDGTRGCIATDGQRTLFSVGNCVFELTDDGRLDDAFGQGGAIYLTYADQPVRGAGITIAASRIVAAGHLPDDSAAIFIGLLPDGELDTSYASNGISLVPRSEPVRIHNMIMLADHSIVAIGTSNGGVFKLRGLIMRVDANGQLHPEFNGGQPLLLDSGYPRTTPLQIASSLTYQVYLNINLVTEDFSSQAALVRLHPTGHLDDAFGEQGWALLDTSFPLPLAQDHAGKLLTTALPSTGTQGRFRVMRFIT